MAGSSVSLVGTLFPELGLDSTVTSDRVIEFWTDFKGKVADLSTQLESDSDTITTWDGLVMEKGGTAATVWIEQWFEEQQFTFSQLLNALQFEQSLEKTLNQAI
ncbi:MAG: hypothetical protein PHH60_00500 [Candidatus Margulisbacteria bacterium]|nr:hypothetical protein [Candidatus Margulisiibacteriota bacterium]